MRTKLLAVLLLLAVAVVAVSGPSDTPLRRALLREPTAGERALERVLPEVRLEGVSFQEAARRLSALAGADITVDPDALVIASSAVTLHLRDATLAEALNRLLQELGSDAWE